VQFRREWFTENEFTHTLEARAGTLDTVGQLMRRRGLRYRKADCLDLPPKLYQTLRTPMTEEQTRAYNDLADTLYAQLQSHDELTVANQLVLQLRLSQVTSGFFPTDDGAVVPFAENPKMDLCAEVVDELLATGASVIVWARYREDVRVMGDRFAAHAPVRIVGGMTDDESDAAIRQFQSGASRLLIGNAQAGGAGLNLQRASYAVYYSQDYSLENRLQTEDRCHRGGSERHARITYIDLICEDTVDGIVADALRRKQSVAAVVTDLRAHLAHAPHAS
jgi:SNF2 family DNA or RNA helicase